VLKKLQTEPIEDNRIDFEDGYGNRPDDEEDGHAVAAADEVAKGMSENLLSPFIGIRVKTFSDECKVRSIRTLDIFLTRLAEKTGGKLPQNFIVTLPKVTTPTQVSTCAKILENLEARLGFAKDSLRMEIMIETTQSIINHKGENTVPLLVAAGWWPLPLGDFRDLRLHGLVQHHGRTPESYPSGLRFCPPCAAGQPRRNRHHHQRRCDHQHADRTAQGCQGRCAVAPADGRESRRGAWRLEAALR
jgi:hypothetical protein